MSHAFKACVLLERIIINPGIMAIMVERELVVRVLGEMDPIKDWIKQQMEKGGGQVMETLVCGLTSNYPETTSRKANKHNFHSSVLPTVNLTLCDPLVSFKDASAVLLWEETVSPMPASG